MPGARSPSSAPRLAGYLLDAALLVDARADRVERLGDVDQARGDRGVHLVGGPGDVAFRLRLDLLGGLEVLHRFVAVLLHASSKWFKTAVFLGHRHERRFFR